TIVDRCTSHMAETAMSHRRKLLQIPHAQTWSSGSRPRSNRRVIGTIPAAMNRPPAPSPPYSGERVGVRGHSRQERNSTNRPSPQCNPVTTSICNLQTVSFYVLTEPYCPSPPALSPAYRGEGANASRDLSVTSPYNSPRSFYWPMSPIRVLY